MAIRRVAQRIVLEYHKIGTPPGGWKSTWYVPEESFVNHLAALRLSGWRVLGLREFLDSLMSMDMSSERVALLTFDDAYLSLHRIALPRLAQFGYPAAVFVPTGFVGRHNGFDCGREPKEEICGWRELAELTRCGISVQSHGVSHRSFAELTSSDVIDEVVRSKQTIEERLGTEVEALAYPFGRVGREFERIRIALIHSGYRAGFLAAGGSLNLPLDWYRLNRLQVFMGTKLSMLLAV